MVICCGMERLTQNLAFLIELSDTIESEGCGKEKGGEKSIDCGDTMAVRYLRHSLFVFVSALAAAAAEICH